VARPKTGVVGNEGGEGCEEQGLRAQAKSTIEHPSGELFFIRATWPESVACLSTVSRSTTSTPSSDRLQDQLQGAGEVGSFW